MSKHPWRASFHGGHSWPFCDHAKGDLRDMIQAAAERGMQVYGVTEHAPRLGKQFLYPDERQWGWTVQTLEEKFAAYFETLNQLIEEFSSDIEVLRGFEIEVVPHSEWVSIMREYRERYDVEYIVGSVHYVDNISIDSFQEPFEHALDTFDGLERLAITYYERVAEMVFNIEPEIVGHLDLIRKFGDRYGDVNTPAIRSAARTALEEIRDRGGILDVNTSPYRKGASMPYPAPWIVQEAHKMGIPFTFGDDSHDVSDVNAHLDDARRYLLELGVDQVTHLRRSDDGSITRRIVSIAYTPEEQERIAWEQQRATPTTSSSASKDSK